MSSKALSRKTFGTANEKYIIVCFTIAVSFFLLNVFSFLIQSLYFHDHLGKVGDFVDSDPIGIHFVGFLISQLFLIMVLRNRMTGKSPTINEYSAFFTGPLAVFIEIYFLNPWDCLVLKLLNGPIPFLEFTSAMFICTIPFVLIISTVSTYFLWKTSKIEKGYEPCKVIYGGEDSETKIMIDDYE